MARASDPEASSNSITLADRTTTASPTEAGRPRRSVSRKAREDRSSIFPDSPRALASATAGTMERAIAVAKKEANWISGCPRSKIQFASTEERSEEHTSELQSRENLVCRLLLEKKKKT